MPANEHYRGYPLPSSLTGFALRTVCFQIPDNDEYKRAFWDRVFQLAQPYNWQQDNYADQRNHVAAEYWEQLLYANLNRFIDDPDCGVPEPNTCQTYPPTAPFIQWFPNDPVYTPDLVGDGYNNPAWYFATLPSNLAYGSQYGDVITSLDRFPPGSLPDIIPASGLPRFRINVVGEGTVKAKLVNMFGGSLIQTTVDDDIGTLNFVDVAKDEIAAPPETNGELIVEFEITGSGAHHIDFIVISWLNSSVPFLHHGGGLRQVELCGFDEMPIYSPPFRFTEECGLEFYDGEAWQPVTGWTDFAPTCFAGAPGAPGAPGADGADGADGAPGAPGADGADGADGATLFMRDTGDGQIQTSPDDAIWSDVTNAKYLHTNADNDPLTGGLDIRPTGTQVSLQVRKSLTGTDNIAEFSDEAGNVTTRLTSDGRIQRINTAGATVVELYNIFGGTRIGAITYGNLNTATVFTLLAQANRPIVVSANSPTTPPMVVGGGLSQTSDLQQWWKWIGDTAYKSRVKNDGSAEFGVNDGGVNSSPDGLTLYHSPGASVPLANFGVGLRLQGKSSTTEKQDMALLRAVWESPTHATRKAQVVLSAFDTAEREILRGKANGTLPEIGFLGQTPQPKITLTGDLLGNEALANLATILEGFGLIVDSTTDSGAPVAPEPDICALDRCNYTELAAKWFAYEVWSKAVFIAGRSDVLLVALERLADITIQIDTLYGKEDSDIYFWVTDVNTIFGGDEGDLEPLQTFIDEGVDYVISTMSNLLYCAVDDCGFIVDFKWTAFIDSLAPSTDAETKVKELLQTMELGRVNDMISHAIHSQYRQELLMSCDGLDCDEWEVLFTTTSPDLSLEEGSAGETEWSGCDGSPIRFRLSGFHVYQIRFTTQTNTGGEFTDPPAEIRAKEVSGSTWHYYAPHTGANDVFFSFDAPSGVDIEISYDGTGAECVSVHALRMVGLGTAPTG